MSDQAPLCNIPIPHPPRARVEAMIDFLLMEAGRSRPRCMNVLAHLISSLIVEYKKHYLLKHDVYPMHIALYSENLSETKIVNVSVHFLVWASRNIHFNPPAPVSHALYLRNTIELVLRKWDRQGRHERVGGRRSPDALPLPGHCGDGMKGADQRIGDWIVSV